MLKLLLLPLLLAAEDWPQFRGPEARGVGQASRLPAEIGPSRNVVWKTPLPGGHSSPVVFQGRIYLTAAEGGTRADAGRQKIIDEGGTLYTYCLRASDGKVLWRQAAPRPRQERYQPTNSAASPSAAVDESGVYVFFGDFGLLAYSHEGKPLWKHPLGPFNNVNGHGSSPVLAGDTLIMLCDQDTGSYLLAVDKRTGRQIWKTPRPESTRSYSTPAIFRPPQGPAEVIVPGSYHLISYSLDRGEKLWWITGLSWQPKSTPIIRGNMIYAHWWEGGGESEVPSVTPEFEEILTKHDTNKDGRISRQEFSTDERQERLFENLDLGNDGWLDRQDWENYRARRNSRNTLLAVKTGGRGDVTATHVTWRMQKFLPNVPLPLLYDNVMYLVKDGGILTALNPEDGSIFTQGRLTGALDTYYASPVAAAGKVYLLSQQGKATVVKAGPKWEVLSSSDFEEEIFATPAIVGNRMYLRTARGLYCFGDKD